MLSTPMPALGTAFWLAPTPVSSLVTSMINWSLSRRNVTQALAPSRVLDGVGQRFLHDPVRSEIKHCGQPVARHRSGQLDVQPTRSCGTAPWERRREPVVRRGRQVPQLVSNPMAQQRIDALDVLRGVAILGTLGTNIWMFTDPGGIIGVLSREPHVGSADDTVELAARFLANGKFLGRYLLPPFVAMGLLGLITTLLLSSTGAPGRCRRGLTAVGRTALSSYIFQNPAASALCYGWG